MFPCALHWKWPALDWHQEMAAWEDLLLSLDPEFSISPLISIRTPTSRSTTPSWGAFTTWNPQVAKPCPPEKQAILLRPCFVFWWKVTLAEDSPSVCTINTDVHVSLEYSSFYCHFNFIEDTNKTQRANMVLLLFYSLRLLIDCLHIQCTDSYIQTAVIFNNQTWEAACLPLHSLCQQEQHHLANFIPSFP